MLVVSRLMIGVVGAGFVVGIRMVSEWFPADEVGTAEGIYGGWGNFGAAAAALALPLVASAVGGPAGWRWAIALTGVMAALYGLVYLKAVDDTPSGVPYQKARKAAALEVTSPAAVRGLIALSVPLAVALGVIAWRIWKVGVISSAVLGVAIAASVALLAIQIAAVLKVNGPARRNAVPAEEHYPVPLGRRARPWPTCAPSDPSWPRCRSCPSSSRRRGACRPPWPAPRHRRSPS